MNDCCALVTVPGVRETAVNVTYEVCFITFSSLHLFCAACISRLWDPSREICSRVLLGTNVKVSSD